MATRNDRYAVLTPSASTQIDSRSEARHDRDRILYSSAFQRLSGITQVVAPTERYPIHNRLTHSLKVAQIGRSLAEKLVIDENLAAKWGGLDPDVVEAAALAHDLGHPPFGHVAEQELDRLVLDKLKKLDSNHVDGFEGNAQSFRIVTKLAVRYPDVEGLNLTRATLCAVQKYPWVRTTEGKRSKKWGAYQSEQDQLLWAREGCPIGDGVQSLEAALMDWSDDVAYAVHDLEDFFRAGLIPLDRLATDDTERDRFLMARKKYHDEHDDSYTADELADAFKRLFRFGAISTPYRGARLDRVGLRSFTSVLIGQYIGAVSIAHPDESNRPLLIQREAELEVAMLKGLTWHYVIESRALVTQRYGQRQLIRDLFNVFCEAAKETADWHIFPAIYQEALEASSGESEWIRLVADLISSMSEAQVVDVHHRLTGLSLGSAMDPVLPQ